MPLTPEEIEHVALLARLSLSEEEREQFTDQLNSILEHFEQLQQIDTKEVAAMTHSVPMSNVLREDEPQSSLSLEEALEIAPEREGDYYRVPRVIE